MALLLGALIIGGDAVAVPVAPHRVSFQQVGCQRELSFEFVHNLNLPHGNSSTCSNGHVFEDGLPGATQKRSVEVDLMKTLSKRDSNLLVGTTGAPTHLTFDWLSCGHPPDAWKKPHYDLHIFKVSKADRPPACVNGVGAGYVCKEKDNPKYFQYGAASEQVLEGMTADVSGILGQGNHWAVRPVRDPSFAEPEVIFMTYDSKVIAFETMLPVSWLNGSLSRNYTFNYKNFSALPTGWHPVEIRDEMVKANVVMRTTVLYDFFPTRCQEPASTEENKAGMALPFFILSILFALFLVQV